MKTRPFFIVSSGRSGTQMMAKLLGRFPEVEMHHEYLCTHVQPLAVKYYMGLVDLDEVCRKLRRLHGAGVHYCRRPLFGDSSNKLSWIIEALDRVFPDALFIHLVRDGRKVVSSFFHKLGDECYDDHSTKILRWWAQDPDRRPEPPPEKKYWWPLPRPGSDHAAGFRNFDQFQRICFHWAEIHREIERQLKAVAMERQCFFRLEDLTRDPRHLGSLLEFLGLPYRSELFRQIQRPHNVVRPMDYPLDDVQSRQFEEIAWQTMETLGYGDTEEYRVVYHPNLENVTDERASGPRTV